MATEVEFVNTNKEAVKQMRCICNACNAPANREDYRCTDCAEGHHGEIQDRLDGKIHLPRYTLFYRDKAFYLNGTQLIDAQEWRRLWAENLIEQEKKEQAFG